MENKESSKKDNKFEVTLINDEEVLTAKEAALPCDECVIDYVDCGTGTRDDVCGVDFA